jgi:hypothetical protein
VKKHKRGVPAEAPDWAFRSRLEIEPGRWRMRNGHIAMVVGKMYFKYPAGLVTVWHGTCLTCMEPKTWMKNGCYAGVGSHACDIVGKA